MADRLHRAAAARAGLFPVVLAAPAGVSRRLASCSPSPGAATWRPGSPGRRSGSAWCVRAAGGRSSPTPTACRRLRRGPPSPARIVGGFSAALRAAEAPLTAPRWEARTGPAVARRPIGLIAGSENQPAKRWPVRHWRELIAALPGQRFVLFGTADDRPIAAAIAAGFSAGRVENLAGPHRPARLRRAPARLPAAGHQRHRRHAPGQRPRRAGDRPVRPDQPHCGPARSSPRPISILQPPGCPPGRRRATSPTSSRRSHRGHRAFRRRGAGD